MLYVITHLKAPWPLGAVVGDVLELGSVPSWAIGKCKPAPEDAEASIEMPEVVVAEEPVQADPQAAAMAQHFREQAQAAIDKAAEAHALELAELRQELNASNAYAADLQAKLEAAQSDEAKAKAALAAAEEQAAQEKAALAVNTTKASGKK